jgi:hypothetical protein
MNYFQAFARQSTEAALNRELTHPTPVKAEFATVVQPTSGTNGQSGKNFILADAAKFAAQTLFNASGTCIRKRFAWVLDVCGV